MERKNEKKEKKEIHSIETPDCRQLCIFKYIPFFAGIAARCPVEYYSSVKPRCQPSFNPETKSIFVEILFAPHFIEMHTLLYCILYIILHLRQRVRACTYYTSYRIILFCWQISL